MSYRSFYLMCCGILLLSGCATSTDPRQGGLFSYSPSAYEQRQQEREAHLNAIREDQRREEAASASLETERSRKAAAVSQQQKQLKSLQSELTATSRNLDKLKASNAAQEAKLAELKRRGGTLNNDMNKAQLNKNPQSREAELERLRRELRQLQDEANALSSL